MSISITAVSASDEAVTSIPSPSKNHTNGNLVNTSTFQFNLNSSKEVGLQTMVSGVTSPSTSLLTLPMAAANSTEVVPDYIKYCPSNVDCQKLSGDCIECDFNESCSYGKNLSVMCRPKDLVICLVCFACWSLLD